MNGVEKCGNCRFHSVATLGSGKGRSLCRLNPPARISAVVGRSSAFFPETTLNTWCGHWMPKGDDKAVIYADYLTDHGHPEAADVLRGFSK